MSQIKKIVLEVGGVELSLSPEDAKTLQNALNELFPVPARQQIQLIPQPYPVYPRPWHWYEYGPAISLLKTTASSTSSGVASGKLNLSGSSFQMLSK